MESVYCLYAVDLPPPSAKAEILPFDSTLYQKILSQGFFVNRAEAEEDEHFRQIIPYAFIMQEGKFLLSQRLKAGQEARLHDRYSLGIGGHINPLEGLDVNTTDLLEQGLIKEVREELHIGAFYAELCGMIHESSNAVSRVHTGLVYKLRAMGEVRIREKDKLTGEFKTLAEVKTHYDKLETWSQAVFDSLVHETQTKL
ncbi:MAG: hypothetical protein R2880_01350 [Deinococcales bacterium]